MNFGTSVFFSAPSKIRSSTVLFGKQMLFRIDVFVFIYLLLVLASVIFSIFSLVYIFQESSCRQV